MRWKWLAEVASAALLVVAMIHPKWIYVAAPVVLLTVFAVLMREG